MYIDNVHLQQVKCFQDVSLRFQSASQTGDPQSNWNVILGNNGDGKTTLLQAIAGCLMDATTAERMIKPQSLVRHHEPYARLTATLIQQDDDKPAGMLPIRKERTLQYIIVNGGQEIQGHHEAPPQFFATATILEPMSDYRALFGEHFETRRDDIDFLKRNAFLRQSKNGWISCGYGAYRRISGFTSHTALVDDPLQKRFLTLFEEGAALYDCESWLKELDRQASKSPPESKQRRTLASVREVIIDSLPEVDDIQIEEEISFLWQGKQVSLEQMSDGYRSMFAFTIDLLRWLSILRSPSDKKLNEVSGVVLIDEIDAHLHPKWQREAGWKLPKLFPRIQFIVASHSPFIAMAAGKGALTLLEREGNIVSANQNVPYLRGWAISKLLTQLFGMINLRDPDTTRKLERYEGLRFARRAGKLKPSEVEELAELEQYLNERLAGQPDCPKKRAFDEDLAFFMNVLKKKKNGAEDA
jgi:predicted ATP-binding protein involved in virulence